MKLLSPKLQSSHLKDEFTLECRVVIQPPSGWFFSHFPSEIRPLNDASTYLPREYQKQKFRLKGLKPRAPAQSARARAKISGAPGAFKTHRGRFSQRLPYTAANTRVAASAFCFAAVLAFAWKMSERARTSSQKFSRVSLGWLILFKLSPRLLIQRARLCHRSFGCSKPLAFDLIYELRNSRLAFLAGRWRLFYFSSFPECCRLCCYTLRFIFRVFQKLAGNYVFSGE